MSFRKKNKGLDQNVSAEKLRASTQDLAAARDKADNLERDLESRETELATTRSRIEELDQKISDLESAEKDHLEKLDDRKAEIDTLKREISRLKSVEEEHERLKAENAKQAEEVSRKTELAALNATITNKDSEIKSLRSQVGELEKSGDVSKKCLKTLKVTIAELEGRLSEKEHEREALAGSFSTDFQSELEQEKKKHSADLQAQVGAIEAKLNEKDKLVESISEDLRRAQEARDKMSQDNQSLRGEAESSSVMERELETLQKQIEALTNTPTQTDILEARMSESLSAKQAELDKLSGELGAAQSLSTQMTRANEDQLTSLTKLHTVVSEQASKIELLEADLAKLDHSCGTEAAARAGAEASCQKLVKEVEKLKGKLSGGTQEVDELNDSIRLLNIELDNIKLKCDADSTFMAALQNDIKTSNGAKAAAAAELASLKDVAQTKQLEIEALNITIRNINIELDNLKLKSAADSTGQESLRDAIESSKMTAEADLKESHDKIAKLETNLSTLQTECNNLKNKAMDTAVPSDLEAKLASKSEELTILASQLTQLQLENTALTASNSSIEDQLKTASETAKSLASAGSTWCDNMTQQVYELEDQLSRATSERDTAIAALNSAQEEISQELEKEVLRKSAEQEETHSLLVVQQENVKTLNSSLGVVESQMQGYRDQLEGMHTKCDQFDTVSADLSKARSEQAALQQKFDELDGKSERVSSKNEKELQDIRAQLNKMTKESESNKKESKRSKDQLLDVKATLSETQTKLSRLSEEKKLLQSQINTPPSTPSPTPTTYKEDISQRKNQDKIKMLEKQISDITLQKEAVDGEKSSVQSTQKLVVAGMLGFAGVSSAVSAYLGTIYSC